MIASPYIAWFFVHTDKPDVIKLSGRSCSSQGYRIAKSESECNAIATQMGLKDTSAELLSFSQDCYNQRYYRCRYSRNNLYWYPNCADNGKDIGNANNLCISGNWKNIVISIFNMGLFLIYYSIYKFILTFQHVPLTQSVEVGSNAKTVDVSKKVILLQWTIDVT